jgi:hypothetical protein
MNLQPQAFQKDAARMAELAGDFLFLNPRHPGCIARIKDFARELRAFLTRWDGQIVRSSDRAAVETFRRQLTGMEQHIESLYLAALRDLVEARREWKLAGADKREAAYRQLHRAFEADWSERLADPLFQGIESGVGSAAVPALEANAQEMAA